MVQKRISIDLPHGVSLDCKPNPNYPEGYHNWFCEIGDKKGTKIHFGITENEGVEGISAEDNKFEVTLDKTNKYSAIRNKTNNNFFSVQQLIGNKSKLEVYNYGSDEIMHKQIFKRW